MISSYETIERDFLDGIFQEVNRLDKRDAHKRHIKTFKIFTLTAEDNARIQDYYKLAKRFTDSGILCGYGLFGSKGYKWVETTVIPQDFIPFYLKRISTATKQTFLRNKTKLTEISLGFLSYRDGALYYKDSLMDSVPKQVVELCKIFLTYPDKFISYDTIQDEISGSKHLSKESMQKLISKLRTTLKERTKKNLIKNVSGKGYKFEVKNIL